MHNAEHFLLAVDDSEASYRAVAYVGQIIGGRQNFRVYLLHALPPLPREFLDYNGPPEPGPDTQEDEAPLSEEPSYWIAAATQAAEPVFARAKGILRQAHVPEQAVETQITDAVNTQDIVRNILEAAHTHHCGTLVVGRESFHGLQALVTSHVGDTLIRQAQGLTVWVVE